ncbi:hypothetical protein [Pyxidicoccus parkwayensis]|jgi:hypothetical protein|nr:hypothetical protein [Pyxidicoccus parkwaysis]
MTFIEQAFGLSPDNGSGLTELALVLVALLAVALFVLRRRAASA